MSATLTARSSNSIRQHFESAAEALVGTYNRRVARPLGRSPGTRCRAEDIRTTHTASVRPRTRNSIAHRERMDPDSDRGRR